MTHRTKGPALYGDTYCSPWCGFGCKKAAFDQATEEAQALADRMGDGWEPHVWENGGWNYEILKGAARITVQTEIRRSDGSFQGDGRLNGGWIVVSYRCWLHATKIQPQVSECAETPEDALGIAMQVARGQIQTAHEALATLY